MSGTAHNSSRAEDRRRVVELRKIHVGKRRLGWDDETYRDVIAQVCNGKRSAADLTQEERGALLDRMKYFGFVEGASYTTKLDQFDDREPQARLIRALWSDLTAIGALRDSSEKALRSFIKRTAKSDSINWLTGQQANACIEGLKAMKSRAGIGKIQPQDERKREDEGTKESARRAADTHEAIPALASRNRVRDRREHGRRRGVASR